MLPLECLYLNKNALVSVVGQQSNPVKHFTLKRKPKSTNLRTELLQKSSDAQSSLKKTTAPTIPLRSRGMPRKMTDTTPLKGIPSRVPVSGFRSPNSTQNPSRPNLIRTPGGRKDGGIKIIELSEQPLGFAAAKKLYSTATIKEEIPDEKPQADGISCSESIMSTTTSSTPISTTSIINSNKKFIKEETFVITKKEIEDEDTDMMDNSKNSLSPTKCANLPFNSKQIKSEKGVTSTSMKSPEIIKTMTTLTTENLKHKNEQQKPSTSDPLINLPNNISVKITPTKIQNQTLVSGSSLIIKPTTPTTIKSIPIANQIKTATSSTGGPVIISQTIIQPAASSKSGGSIASSSSGFVLPSNASIIRTTTAGGQQKIILAHSSQSNTVPSLTSLSQQSPPNTQTKIILKTSAGGQLQPLVVTSRAQQNNPSGSQSNRAVTIQPASQAAQAQHLLLQQQQQKQDPQNFTQVVMTSTSNNSTSGKGKTLYIPQKAIVLQNIGGDMYKQIPISNVSNLQTLTATSSNQPPNLVQTTLTTSANKSAQQQIPALIPSSNLPVVIQQQPQSMQTIISAV
uniref:HDAg domain-containing protein n=1 Tax=Megaselia scalaris TaxID=36166 RepID=T1GFF8_MEGSC